MLTGNMTLFVAGLLLAGLLLALGGYAGFRYGAKRSDAQLGLDRHRVLQLLQELGAWTSEYSGNVSRYQSQLGAISQAVHDEPQSSSPRVLQLLEEIMRSNKELQTRLDAAENQLDKQTRQIESYLSEARTDALTGLPNRRAFDQRLDEMFSAYHKGNGRSFVLALIDIDHFKRINDECGHQAGDDVLRQVATLIAQHLDSSYLVARYGGEEFAALLPSPLRLSSDRVDRMRKGLAEQAIDADGRTVKVTISVGLSEMREDTATAALIRRADEALYAAKGRGRNRVYSHDGNTPILHGAPEIVSR